MPNPLAVERATVGLNSGNDEFDPLCILGTLGPDTLLSNLIGAQYGKDPKTSVLLR